METVPAGAALKYRISATGPAKRVDVASDDGFFLIADQVDQQISGCALRQNVEQHLPAVGHDTGCFGPDAGFDQGGLHQRRKGALQRWLRRCVFLAEVVIKMPGSRACRLLADRVVAFSHAG